MYPFFVLIFCVCFLFCISWLCCLLFFVNIFLICILNFNRNRQNNITMTFQDASCLPLAVSVLSSSVEPPSQSLAVSVSSSIDVTVMTRRSTWSSTAMSVKPFLNIFHVPATRCPVFWRNGLKCIFCQLFYVFLL